MTDDFEVTGDPDIEVVDIDGAEGWKKEVQRLLDENYHLKNELVASQLMTGLILQQTGPVTVDRDSITKGLPGRHLELTDGDGVITFSLADEVE